jgi:hypothetical protein
MTILMFTKKFIVMTNKMITQSLIIMRQMAMDTIRNWLSSHVNCVFCILIEVGGELELPI